MSKITNIGVLDVRNISEEIANKITIMENIGILIESDRSQSLLKNVRKSNIGDTILVPLDKDIKFAMHNGIIEIDKEYLEGIEGEVAFLINGQLIFKNHIDPSLLNEKLFLIKLNGEIICPKSLKGLIQTKSSINGMINAYESDHNYIDNDIQLDNRFLKSLKKDSKLSFNKLMILEPMDKALLDEKISNIEVVDKLVIREDLEEDIAQYMKEYYLINKVILPNLGGGVKVVNKDLTIDNISLLRFNNAVLYVDGKCNIDIDESMEFYRHIKYLKCDKVTVSSKVYYKIYNSIDEETEIEITEGKIMKNNGSLILSGIIENSVSINNMGKLIIDKNIDINSFNNNIVEIRNFGKVEAPEEILPLIRSKITLNNGKISAIVEKNEKEIIDEEDILYQNLGELKL